MNVRELIEKLQQYDGDLIVVAQDGSEPSDLCEVTSIYGDGAIRWFDKDWKLYNNDRAIALVTP